MYDTFKVHYYLWLNYPKTVALIFHVTAIVFCIKAGCQIALSADCYKFPCVGITFYPTMNLSCISKIFDLFSDRSLSKFYTLLPE